MNRGKKLVLSIEYYLDAQIAIPFIVLNTFIITLKTVNGRM